MGAKRKLPKNGSSCHVENSKQRRQRPIRVGTDCAGIMGASLAMEKLGLRIEHVFVSEKEAFVRRLITHNFGIKRKAICTDVMARNNSDTPPCDIYTAGFPCQPFSSEGQGGGQMDKWGRGIVAWKLVGYVAAQHPCAFVFENVSNIEAKKFEAFRSRFLGLLRGIRRAGKKAYRVETCVLNAKDHGVPQSRKRWYVVGLRKDLLRRKFEWPSPTPTPPLNSVLDNDAEASPPPIPDYALPNILTAIKRIQKLGHDVNKAPMCAEVLSGLRVTVMKGVSPCLTRTRCASGGHYLVRNHRLMTTSEILRLQGVDPTRLTAPSGVSERQLRMAIGNAFTVTVFERLISNILKSIELPPRCA